VLVDSGAAASADAVIEAIRELGAGPIRYIVNTTPDDDHVGGNEKIARALGRTIFNAGNALGAAMTNNGAASILANERVLFRMSAPTGQPSPYPAAAWPTETFQTGRKYMRMNRDAIEIVHQPAAHTDGDSVVVFRRADVIAAGDVIDTRRFPVIDLTRGGSVNGEIAALNFLVGTAVPNFPLIWQDEVTLVVPGHGRIVDQTDIAEYRDMVTIIRDRIEDGIRSGMSLAQIKAASPTQGYTGRYGAGPGGWTTDMFIEAVYESLSKRQ
jgi:glyoxylase-like metal-dependent hydrolase (beta-lactamase superfamily II)